MAPKRVLDADLDGAGCQPSGRFSEAALDAYGIKELNILEEVLRRASPPPWPAVAQRIRAKIGYRADVCRTANSSSAYYIALRGRLETRLLFGRRRRDKYEPV